MRRRISYANVAATLALVLSMSGGALAATHYLINSTKQISPKVLKKLKGATGAPGATGARGATGATGATGKEGAGGKEGKEGKEGARGPSEGFQAFKDSAGSLGAQATIGTLAVPAGSYLVSAKLWVINQGAERAEAFCVLTNDINGDKDETNVTADPIGATGFFGRASVSLQAASTLSAAGHWLVKCGGGPASALKAENLKIHAIQVATLSNSSA